MDCNALLERARAAAERVLTALEADETPRREDSDAVAAALLDLDEWLCKGGSLPADWQVSR